VNHRLKGYRRDKMVLQTIEKCEALTTEQIDALFFSDIKTGYRKAQERLLKLYKRKNLKRFRPSIDCPYIYYTRRREQLDHRLAVNWVYVWLTKKKWHNLVWWYYEQDYKILKCDSFAGLKNIVTGQYKFYFVEVEMDSHRRFDKVARYNELYGEDKYLNWWWVEYAKTFPTIIVVCKETKRKREIEKAIETDNKYGLDFRLYDLGAIIRDCRSRTCSRNI